MRLHLCGVRGSTPAPGPEFVRYGGHTSCVALAHDRAVGPTLVLDAGTGLRQVTALLGGQPFRGTILLTHLHWDHAHGLPFFTAGDRDGSRVTLLLPAQPDGAAWRSTTGGAWADRRGASQKNATRQRSSPSRHRIELAAWIRRAGTSR